MKDLKKTLRLAGIFCMIALCLCVGELVLDLFVYEFSIYLVLSSSVSIALTSATGITYFVLMNKSIDKIVRHKNVFLVLSIINIFNNIIVWIIAFWVQVVIGQHAVKKRFTEMFSTPEEKKENNSDVIIIDDYEIHTAKETLVSRLEELGELRQKQLITEEEYKNLREEAIRKFMHWFLQMKRRCCL